METVEPITTRRLASPRRLQNSTAAFFTHHRLPHRFYHTTTSPMLLEATSPNPNLRLLGQRLVVVLDLHHLRQACHPASMAQLTPSMAVQALPRLSRTHLPQMQIKVSIQQSSAKDTSCLGSPRRRKRPRPPPRQRRASPGPRRAEQGAPLVT